MSSINNVERFRKRLEENKICVGTSVQLCDPLVSELAAEAGNDFLWIEMEHSHMGLGVWSTPCGRRRSLSLLCLTPPTVS